MKKFIIVGSGTSGLIAATMIKRRWKNRCSVSVIYDSSKKNIGVGESTTPIVHLFLEKYLGATIEHLITNTSTTMKVGINFKNWIPDKEYFHGFPEVDWEEQTYPSSAYSIIHDHYNGGLLHNKADNTIPSSYYRKLHALHIDTQEFSTYVHNNIKNEVDFIDDIVEQVHSDGENITGLTCKNSGRLEADFYIDASGFDALLLRELDPKWNDISEYLPLDRAIPQQIPYEFDEVPSYTVAEATKNGWIWQIPIGDRYGTGYIYSSRFTSDEEAREDYNSWLKENFNTELKTDRIIEYKPGYYEDYWIGNCLSVGLSSGFVEPLESTGIHIIVQQLENFVEYNASLKNLNYTRKQCNRLNRTLYKEIVEFICLHYNTNREDSDFWEYMKENKTEWLIDFDDKCRNEFLLGNNIENDKVFWEVNSYIQVAHGLEMFNKESIREFIDSQPDKDDIIENCELYVKELQHAKDNNTRISHKEFLSMFR